MAEREWSDRKIEEYARGLARRIGQAGREARNEEELRLGVTPLLRRFAADARIDLEERHEKRLVGRGRADSVYGRVWLEYKAPRSLSERNSAAKNRAAIEQVQGYLESESKQERQDLGRMVGVVLDGVRMVFVRHRRGEWEVGTPREVDASSVADLLVRLRSLRGKALVPKELVRDFGGVEVRGKFTAAPIAERCVGALYKALCVSKSPKVEALFGQWRLLFSEVCGYEFASPKLDVEGLGGSYGVTLRKGSRARGKRKPAEAERLFFAIHTYYATVITLLAAEIVTYYGSRMMPSYLGKLEGLRGEKLREELADLHERGGIFGEVGVQNFLEGDFFGWYLEEWSEELGDAIQSVVRALRQYDPATFQVEPDETRDLLKKLYQYLLPKKLRHDLGEYYTPDWLAELVLEEIGYRGDLSKRILDPACGSGTFLALEIVRAKKWARDKMWGERETVEGILAGIVGFDLNPVAVITARTNYLIALGELLRHHGGRVEIPVYLCDSVLRPTEPRGSVPPPKSKARAGRRGRPVPVGERQVGLLGRPMVVDTAVGSFAIPVVLATQKGVSALAGVLEEGVRGHYQTQEFLERAKRELALSAKDFGEAEETLGALYGKLCQVDEEGRNGIWARIIKNFFAPVFQVAERKFEYVAGNPPWINWESLPDQYRESTRGLWQDYGMAAKARSAQFELGTVKRDLSALFLYVAGDKYLEEGGRLGFLITQTLFKSAGAGEGFRRFELPAEPARRRAPLGVVRVHDLVEVKPFEGAANRTAAVALVKGRQTKYPVGYVVWRRKKGEKLADDMQLTQARAGTRRERHVARPITSKRGAPWTSGPAAALEAVEKVAGKSDYKAWAGACTWLNGVYWVHVVERLRDGKLLIENLHDVGKIAVRQVHRRVEADLVYPLLRGREVEAWKAQPAFSIIVPHTPAGGWEALPEATMRTEYPLALAYFRRFEEQLLGRSGYRQLRRGHPFYILGNVGARSFADWKVVWPGEVAASLRAAVVGTREGRAVVPDQTVYFVSFESADAAHFLAGMLNSSPIRAYYRFRAYKHTSMQFVSDLGIPRFNASDALHRRLAELSQGAHEAAARGDEKRVGEIEEKVDEAGAELWGMTGRELEVIRRALRD